MIVPRSRKRGAGRGRGSHAYRWRGVCAEPGETALGETALIVAVSGLANPKSISFAPDFVSMMLPGFKSRWMMPSR